MSHRTSFFIKFPGRNLGGIFSFFSGFRHDTWFACAVFIFSTPAIFVLNYKVLKHFQLHEKCSWNYIHNIFVMFGALSQQVMKYELQIIRQCSCRVSGGRTHSRLLINKNHLCDDLLRMCHHLSELLCFIHKFPCCHQ